MKKLFCILALGLIGLSLPQKSEAIIHVGASLALSGDFDLKENEGFDGQKTSGYGFSVVVPFGLMLRYDMMEVTMETAGDDIKADIGIPSLGYRLGFPLTGIHIAGAYGIGAASYNKSYKDSDLTQIFLELGYNIIPLFDIYFGYHSITGEKIEGKSGGELKSSLTGTVYSLGVNFGF